METTKNLDQPQMQALVGFGVVGGVLLSLVIAEGIKKSKMSQDEKDALKNVPKFVGAAVLTYGVFYLLDIDKKWWTLEGASTELERVIREHMP